MFVLANMWFQTLMRTFFFNIDKLVYNFISMLYEILINIARTSILSHADLAIVANRVYELLAVFMVFKVTFSLIMYVVNPDDFSDKSKGVTKLGTNIIISLSLLILTPYIFSYAYQLQTIILEDNSLSALIFGDDQSNYDTFNSAGDTMAYMTMLPFFAPNLGITEAYECAQLTTNEIRENGRKVFNESCSGLTYSGDDWVYNNDTTSLYALAEESNGRFSIDALKNYVTGVEIGNFPLMFRLDIATATDVDNENYIIEYRYVFSTIVGVVIVLLLISFCMDVALRSIKLAVLQLVAPIPIISYVDPKSGKDGLFKKWYQMCFKTYLSLFIRLLALYFAVFIIARVDRMTDIITGAYVNSLIIKIFIIIGALMFAKQLPKLLEGLGIKLDGGFQLNPLKKFEDQALGGKQMVKTAKTAFRPVKGVATAGLVGGAAVLTGQGLRGMGKAFGGALRGEKFGRNFSNSYKAAHERKKQVANMRANGVSPMKASWESFKSKFVGTTAAEKVGQVESKAKAVQSQYEAMKNQAIACDKNDNSYTKDADGNKLARKSAKTIAKELEQIEKTQIDRASFKDIAGKTKAQQVEEARTSYDTRIAELKSKKLENTNRSGELNLEITRLRNEQSKLSRSDYSSDTDFYAANAAYTQRIAALQDQKNAIEGENIDDQIHDAEASRDALNESMFDDIEGKTVEEQYQEAVDAQKKAKADKESELEKAINELANGQVFYETTDETTGETVERQGTGQASADKVIRESKEAMISLARQVNQTGKEVDDEFEEMYVPSDDDIENGNADFVTMSKSSKGAVAQTSSGKMAHIKDVAQYTKSKK